MMLRLLILLATLLAPRTKRQVWLTSGAHLLTGTPPGDVYSHADAPRIDLDAITESVRELTEGDPTNPAEAGKPRGTSSPDLHALSG